MSSADDTVEILRVSIFGDDIFSPDEFDLLIDFCRFIANRNSFSKGTTFSATSRQPLSPIVQYQRQICKSLVQAKKASASLQNATFMLHSL